MPEGHTLRRLADDLAAAFAGRVLEVSSPQGRFAEEAALLDRTALVGADASGKHLFLEFEGDRVVHVHLGLYGTFRISAGPPPDPVGQVRLRLVAGHHHDDGAEPAYADLRGATRCVLATPAERDAARGRLGPDPLKPGADPAPAWERVRRTGRTVGELLMDQQVLAGIGNVYRAEVLFRHRIHPLRPGRTLRRSQWQAMWDDLVVLMAEGARLGRIDTVRPEHRSGRGPQVYVYRRHDQPCRVCGATVRRAQLATRTSYWCPRCQPVFRSRAATRR